jgi:hypothetical protein
VSAAAGAEGMRWADNRDREIPHFADSVRNDGVVSVAKMGWRGAQHLMGKEKNKRTYGLLLRTWGRAVLDPYKGGSGGSVDEAISHCAA